MRSPGYYCGSQFSSLVLGDSQSKSLSGRKVIEGVTVLNCSLSAPYPVTFFGRSLYPIFQSMDVGKEIGWNGNKLFQN